MGHWRPGPNPTADLVLLRVHPAGGTDVLLIRRGDRSDAHPGRWAVPGGFVETASPKGVAWAPGTETPHDAVIRELLEELKLEIGRKGADET